ncbi:MAG: tetratricopeptide repeat protein [Lentisphaeria bacterium]|jgi:tetratricopeptide (TPR) repeat protein
MIARTNTLFRRRAYAAAKTLLIVISLGAAMVANAIDPFKADLRAVRKLAELELNDYAEMQIQQMQQRYPDQKDAINLEKARVYYTIGRSADADAALKTITAKSNYFLDAVLLKAEVAAARKQFDEADKAYKVYFAKVTTAPADEDELAQFTRAVKIYSLVLRESGKGKEAAAILSKLGDSGGIDERQMTFLKLTAMIDAEAKKQDERQAINIAGLQKTMNELKSLQYIRDGVGASAFLQLARVQVMLGRDAAAKAMSQKKPADLAKITYFKEAIKTINTADAFLEELEGTMGKADRSKSPLAEALYHKGQAIQLQGFATTLGGDKNLGRRQTLAAAKYYETLIEEYPDSPFRSKAMEAHAECAKFAEQMFDEKIELTAGGDTATIDLKLEQAETQFMNKNYAAVVPIYLEAVRAARLSKKLPEVVMRLAICLAQLDRPDEAEALVSYLQDVLPREAGTAESAYRLGGVLYERARRESNPLVADDLLARAMRVWDIFITLDPSHPKAPDVAFACAEQQYKVASDLVRRAAEAKDDKTRAAIQQEALDAYRAAIPKYQRLVEVFSAFDKGVRALYKLGWIYHSLGENALGAEAFLAYYEEENDQQYQDDRLEAKFRAGELLMLGETPADAVQQFLDIAQLFAGGGSKTFNLKSATAVRIAEDAAAYLPWSYDLTAEKIRPTLNSIRDRQAEAKARIKAIQDAQAGRQATLEQMLKEFEAVADENAAMELLVSEASLDFLSLARKQLQERLANTAGMSDAEKQIHLQTVEQEVRKRAADLEKQKQNTVAGELLSMDERLAALRTARDDDAAKIEAVTKRHQELQADWKELDKRSQQLKAEVTKQRDAAAAIEKEAITVEADKQRLEAAVAAATDKVNDSQGADKAKAQAELERANAELAEIHKKMEDVYQRKATIITPEKTKKLADDSAALKQLAGESADLARQVRHAELLVTAAKQDAELVNAKIQTATRRRKLAEETAVVLAKPAAEREPLLAGLRQTAAGAREAQAQVSAIAEAKINNQKNAIAKEAELDKQAIAEAEAEIAQLDQDLKPVQEEFDKWKKQAIQGFEAFRKAYPKSAKAPDNLSRLGTIYMEMGDHAKASAALELLARDFPDSEASKMALVNLGRAQMESGNREAAAKSFQDLMSSKADTVSVPNLSYIADAALELNIPNAALAACREIISRSKQSNHPEAELVTGGVKDRAYVRAAEATLKLNRLTETLNYIDTLLKENPRTAYFYDAKFLQAQAKAKNTPPDYDGAIEALQEILQYADNQTISNRALCELGEILAKSNDPTKKQQAIARFHLVAMFGDTSAEANREYVERSIIGYARLLAENNEQDDIKVLLDKYKKDFPNGKFTAELNKLAR